MLPGDRYLDFCCFSMLQGCICRYICNLILIFSCFWYCIVNVCSFSGSLICFPKDKFTITGGAHKCRFRKLLAVGHHRFRRKTEIICIRSLDIVILTAFAVRNPVVGTVRAGKGRCRRIFCRVLHIISIPAWPNLISAGYLNLAVIIIQHPCNISRNIYRVSGIYKIFRITPLYTQGFRFHRQCALSKLHIVKIR